jgi:NADPH2:quinone reductase
VTDLPSTMLAAHYPTSGPAVGTITIERVPRPDPGTGEVLVAVAVSGVNPTDWKGRAAASGSEWIIPNQDGAGTIVAVGTGVPETRVGERVWLWQAQWQRSSGTAAQYIALPSDHAVALPEGASFDLGAGLGIPFMTAHRCLFMDGALAPGTTVLVQGGAGAVGHAAIQLARRAGARVAASVSSQAKAALATEAGAELVVNYRDEDVVGRLREWARDGVGRIIEVNLDANLSADAEVIAPGGPIVSYASPAAPLVLPRTLMMSNARLEFVMVYTISAAAKQAAVTDITAALQASALAPLPAVRFSLEEAAAAHDAVRDGAVGKVLIDIPPA